MQNHPTAIPTPDRLTLGASAKSIWIAAAILGAVGLLAAIASAFADAQSLRRFYFAYLISFSFFLSIALGSLFFVLLQHLTRAGWSVSVRRIAEAIASTLPVLAILALPIAVSVLLGKGDLYSWAVPLDRIEHDHVLLAKRAFLNPAFFLVRLAIYFSVWSTLALWYWRQSVQQDQDGNPAATTRMQAFAAPAMILYAITVTFAAFDLLMSLDPRWASTIFGVYFFAGCAVSIFSTLILSLSLLQRRGILAHSATTEHYHDLGKFLFAFVFFWGYIAYSQYMLIWYGNIPEEIAWLLRRGLSTSSAVPALAAQSRAFGLIAIVCLFCQLLIPFAGLLSRRVKRNPPLVAFWSIWLLLFHWLDLYWLIMPELGRGARFGLVEIAAFIGIGGLVFAAFVRRAAGHSLRPLRDPRLDEALTFENV